MSSNLGTTPKLVVFSAPSGAGKSTLVSMLLSRHPRLISSISYTTRAPRGQEQDGVHYYFVSSEKFEEMRNRGQFLECAHVFNKYWYGTARSTVEAALGMNKSILFDIDVQGARALKSAFLDRCITIFILPPSFEELEARLRARATDSPESIRARLQTAKLEIAAAPDFDYRVTNNDLGQTAAEIESILTKEGCV